MPDEAAQDGVTSRGREGVAPSPEIHRLLFEHALNGIAYCRMIFDGDRPADFVFLAVNPAFRTLTGLGDVTGRRVTEVIPTGRDVDRDLLDVYGRVVRTGIAERLERYDRPLDRWFSLSVHRPHEGHFVVVFERITDRKRAEIALRESEVRFATMFGVAIAGILVLRAADHRIVDANEMLSTQLGYSHDELVGKTTAELGLFVDRALRDRLVAELDATGTLRPARARVRCKSGEEREFLMSAGTAVLGGERCTIGFWQDVTDIARADASRREVEAQVRAIFDAAPIGLVVADLGMGRIERVNEAMCTIFGRTAAELHGSRVGELTHPDDRARDREYLGRVARGELEGFEYEKRYLRSDGRVMWGHVNVVALPDPSGKPTRAMATIEDITERREAEERHRLALDAAELGTWRQDATTGLVTLDERAQRHFGLDRPCVTVDEMLSHAQPDDSRAIREAIASAVERTQSEHRVVLPSGDVRWISVHVRVQYDAAHRPVGAVATSQDVTDAKRAAGELRASEERYRTLVDDLDDVILTTDESLHVTFVNSAVARFGFRPDELLGRSTDEFVHPDDRARYERHIELRRSGAAVGPIELRVFDAAGKPHVFRVASRLQRTAERITGFTTILSDVTRQRETEEQLRVAQKMEAIGRLAGGVAHDFNNILSVILSYGNLALAELEPEDPLSADIDEIVRAAKRAESLTRQLLAFSRRQVLTPESVQLNELIEGMAKMLGRLLGEDVEVSIEAAPGLSATRADRGQLEQVVMNLAVNARDAMPGGGRITISTADAVVDGARATALEVPPGRYVELAFADTGCGMDDATLARIFEPFFTTKGPGKGTGLGLAMIYGIVRQSGGGISVESQPGRGTTFRIVLPRDVAPRKASGAMRLELGAATTGTESILVVEDEPPLRNVIRRTLSKAGYRVTVAANASQAIDLCGREAKIDLVLTDVIMPGMSGVDLAMRLAKDHPSVKVLFMSGYTGDAIERFAIAPGHMLRKPFDSRSLTRAVRLRLDEQ